MPSFNKKHKSSKIVSDVILSLNKNTVDLFVEIISVIILYKSSFHCFTSFIILN